MKEQQTTRQDKLEKSYTPEKSTTYGKSNADEGRINNYMHSNSPYRERVTFSPLKTSQNANVQQYPISP